MAPRAGLVDKLGVNSSTFVRGPSRSALTSFFYSNL